MKNIPNVFTNTYGDGRIRTSVGVGDTYVESHCDPSGEFPSVVTVLPIYHGVETQEKAIDLLTVALALEEPSLYGDIYVVDGKTIECTYIKGLAPLKEEVEHDLIRVVFTVRETLKELGLRI